MSERCSYVVCVIFCMLIHMIWWNEDHKRIWVDLLQSSLIWSSASIMTTNTYSNSSFPTDSIRVFASFALFVFHFVNHSWILQFRLLLGDFLIFACLQLLLQIKPELQTSLNECKMLQLITLCFKFFLFLLHLLI